ncbi:hypothetical protein FKM82_023830 [Ascaphus truei]
MSKESQHMYRVHRRRLHQLLMAGPKSICQSHCLSACDIPNSSLGSRFQNKPPGQPARGIKRIIPLLLCQQLLANRDISPTYREFASETCACV